MKAITYRLHFPSATYRYGSSARNRHDRAHQVNQSRLFAEMWGELAIIYIARNDAGNAGILARLAVSNARVYIDARERARNRNWLSRLFWSVRNG